MNKRETFSTFSPIVNLIFFVSAIVFGMFYVHPEYLLCAFIASTLYYATIYGRKVMKLLLGIIPVVIVIALINPLFNTSGETVLFTYFGGRAYTLEALFYGAMISIMFVSIIMWFMCYSYVMTNDKFMYIFGGMMPKISLVLTMILRLIPSYRDKFKQIHTARASLGIKVSSDRASSIANAYSEVLALTGWALENGVVMADSMRSRGYGTGVRSSYSIYRFDRRDRAILIVMIVLIVSVIVTSVLGATSVTYYPKVSITGDIHIRAIGVVSYALLLLIPTIVGVVERLRWHILISKI